MDGNPIGRRERAKEEKRGRILLAARQLFGAHGISAVTTQQVAEQADVAIGTLFLYASSKAELLIMVQNEKFAAAIADGLAAVELAESAGAGIEKTVLALITPIVTCVREQVENGRTYLNELAFGDPTEPHRRAGLELSLRMEESLVRIIGRSSDLPRSEASALARVISAVIHFSTTATVHVEWGVDEVLEEIRGQLLVVLAGRASA